MRRSLLMLVAVMALVGAACSSNDGSGGGAGGGGGGCTASKATDLSSDDPFTVTIQNFVFHPDCFKAASASAITIENEDGAAHTFTIEGTDVDVTIDGGRTFNGESLGLAPGSYDFRCTLHPTMTGTLIVSTITDA